MASRITPFYVGQKMVEFGVLTQEQVNLCSRIVLDCPANGLPVLHVELAMTDDVMDKIAPLMAELMPQSGPVRSVMGYSPPESPPE